MSNINQTGTFRGDVLDRGMGTSSGGFPQLILSMRATEKWDDDNEVWTPWDYEESEAVAYLVLFGAKGKPTLNVRQAMQAFNWDGASFVALQEDKGLADKIQWRMAASTYEGVERIKPEWINAFDADPHRSVSKLDVSNIKKLDAQYAAALKTLGGGPKPKSAKPVAPDPMNGVTPAPAPSAPSAGLVPAQTPAIADPLKPKRGHPTAPKPVPTPAAPTASEPLSQADAWGQVYDKANKAGKTDLEITNAWVATVHEFGGDEKIGDWSGVATKTVAALGV